MESEIQQRAAKIPPVECFRCELHNFKQFPIESQYSNILLGSFLPRASLAWKYYFEERKLPPEITGSSLEN